MAAPEIAEQFTFRSDANAITVEAIIDTGATSTVITREIVAALGLPCVGEAPTILAGGSAAAATYHRCTVAWTIYEKHGFHSEHDVICLPRGDEVLIGFDFLSRHGLKVDLHHRGLVGSAPDAAVPLTGGGYVINAPREFVRRTNHDRIEAAAPGEVLRPHPAWRFRVPSITKSDVHMVG